MDLSKAFDTLNHDLLIAKLHAYGFDIKTLKLLHSYLTKRWQRTKVNSSFSTWSELLQGVPQGSVLGPILFNMYLNDLFYLTEMTQVRNFADDTTFCVCDKDLNILINRLEDDTSLAVEWFENNFMKLNQEKCHLLVSGHEHETVWAKIGETKIWESNKQKLLGVVIDRNLNFDECVFDLCKKTGRKLSVLARLSNYMSFEKRKILLKAFAESQFGYCPLTWMFYELFKIKNNLSVTIMNDIFQPRAVRYNLRSQIDFTRPNVNSEHFGISSLRYMTAKVWDMVPNGMKNVNEIETFKNNIRKRKPVNCHCKLCLDYVSCVGYVNTF